MFKSSTYLHIWLSFILQQESNQHLETWVFDVYFDFLYSALLLICFSVFFIAFYLRILWLLLFFNSFVARDKSFTDFCCSALQQNRCGIKYAQKRPQNERRKIMFLHNLKFKSKNSRSLFALPMSLCLPWTLICTFSHLKWCKVTANPTTRPFT